MLYLEMQRLWKVQRHLFGLERISKDIELDGIGDIYNETLSFISLDGKYPQVSVPIMGIIRYIF